MPLQHKKEFFYVQLSQTANSIVIIFSLTNYTATQKKTQRKSELIVVNLWALNTNMQLVFF